MIEVEKELARNYIENLYKEYEYVRNRSSEMYPLAQKGMQLFLAFFFGIFTATIIIIRCVAVAEDPGKVTSLIKYPSMLLLTALIVFGILHIFIHIAIWAARNHFRRKLVLLRDNIFCLKNDDTIEDIIKYVCMPRYQTVSILSLSMFTWYLYCIFICNSMALIFLLIVVHNFIFQPYLIFIGMGAFVIQLIIANQYIMIKKKRHDLMSNEKRRKINRRDDLYKILNQYYKSMHNNANSADTKNRAAD